ncbi:MAG: isochorismatase family protein [Planctomycetes bacterium]|nr:isochorismatase family protein [Planctomycetota bacterium]
MADTPAGGSARPQIHPVLGPYGSRIPVRCESRRQERLLCHALAIAPAARDNRASAAQPQGRHRSRCPAEGACVVKRLTAAVLWGLSLVLVLADFPQAAVGGDVEKTEPPLELRLRSRKQTSPGGRFRTVYERQRWKPRETAVIVCDMWDLHHGLNATRRGAELAPRMNALLETLRSQGVSVIHAPSGCTEAYADHPARRRAQAVPRSENLPADIGKWCYKIPAEEAGEYPIDQKDGGEDDDPAEHAAWAKKLEDMGRNPRAPWKKQTDLLTIADQDFISDSGEEIWSILEKRGIENVILVGVHTNMCVLGRPFGLRQMAKNGKNVVLMRDMTDTMYNPLKAPFVSHFTGTDLIVEHIEKYVCPTVSSEQVLCGQSTSGIRVGAAFRFKNDTRPRLVIAIAEDEYKTDETLPVFAREHLGKHFQVTLVYGGEGETDGLPGHAEALSEADALLVSVRRLPLRPDQIQALRKFVAAGKPVLGIRTANHAFSLRGAKPPEGTYTWEEFDAEVIGGHYTGHHGNGPKTEVRIAEGAEDHPVLRGVDVTKLTGHGSLYKVSPLADSARPLLIGSIPEKPAEPIAWINVRDRSDEGHRARTFYTSLGHPQDFEQPEFNRVLRNAVYWMAGVEVRDEVAFGY